MSAAAVHEAFMVVGLDGVPYWLLQQLADDGVMPAIRELLPQGTLRPLRAPVPEISSTSWASFMTGADPGRHGIYGFIDLEEGTYDTYFPNLRHLQATPVWEQTAAAGARSLVLNVPGSYPAVPVHGVLVSGFVAPDFDRAVQPADLAPVLRNLGYELDVEVGDVAADPDSFLDRAEAALAARRAAFRHLLADEDWRLAICVLTETDRVHHFLWDSLMDPTARLHQRILGFYRKVDQTVAELAEYAGDGGLILVSDHGFGSASTQFVLNAWLRRAGYLHLPADAGSLREITESTIAFALDPGRIYLNRRWRFPRGRDIAAETADEIACRLLALRIAPDGTIGEGGPGRPLVAEVLRGPEIYSGPYSDLAPDLVAMPAPDVQIRGTWATDELVLSAPFTGTHTKDDATFWCRGDRGTGSVEMRDVAPTVLAGLGIPFAASMQGRDVRGRHTAAPAVTLRERTSP
ncbi:alkaline phosphatase family protein [Micromonospora chokoriensis]